MEAEKVLKIFAEAVEKKEWRFIAGYNIIEKNGYYFTYYSDTGFVRAEKEGEPFTRLFDLGTIKTLKGLKMRLGL